MKRALCLFFLVGFFVLHTSQTWAAEKTPIKHLCQAVLSGKLGSVSETAWGYIDAAAYTNERGGVNGRKYEIILEDYSYEQDKSLTIYNRVVNAQPKNELFFNSAWGTGTLLANAERVKEDKIICIDGAMSTQIFDENVRKNYPYYFSVGVTYGDQFGLIYKFLKETLHKGKQGKPKVAFIYMDHAAGIDPINKMKMYADRFGIDLVLIEPISFTATDYTTTMMKIRESGADYVACNIWGVPTQTRWLKAVKNYLPNKTILAQSYFALEIYFDTAGDAFDNVYMVSLYPTRNETDNPLVKTWNDIIKKKERKVLSTEHYIHGWLMVRLGAEAARRADVAGKLTRDGVRDALENMKDWTVDGLYNGKALDYSMHCFSDARILRSDFKTKSLIPVTDWLKVSDYLK